MAKKTVGAPRVLKVPIELKKRVAEELESETSDEEFSVNGLLDDEASEASDEEPESESETESEIVAEQVGEEDDSEDELNKLLGEEDEDTGDIDSDDFSDDHNSDTFSISERMAGTRIRTNSASSVEDVVHTTYSDGKARIIKPEINPVYDSDDSDHEAFNTIGNVPLLAYDEMPHVGYDINGKRIMRPAKGSALDQLLESIDLPEGWTGLLDQNTGGNLKLSDEELELIRKIQQQENTSENIDPYEPYIDWFTRHEEVMPLTAVPEPKRRFVPSKHEAKRVMKIVRAIREGRIVLPNKVREQREEEQRFNTDLWKDEVEQEDHIMTLRAPKVAPPTNEESYNPPAEYLMNEDELKKWKETDPMERTTNFVPQKYSSLRHVPGYLELVRERFERCLDLYLAPRVRHNKLNIDPESLIPDLPLPQDLRPFPIRCSTIYKGHTEKVRTVSIDPQGLWLATGSDDGSVRIWEILTGRQVFKAQLVLDDNTDDHIECLEWNPDPTTGILAVLVGEHIFLMVPPIFGFDIENTGRLRIEAGWGYDTFGNKKSGDINVEDEDDENTDKAENSTETKKDVAKWYTPNAQQTRDAIAAVIQCRTTVKKLSWHRKGDYFVSVAPDSRNTAVLIHQLSKHLSQSPFRKSKGIIMDAKFHPFKPQLFVASQRTIKIYDLAQQQLIKKLMPGARMLSGIDIHPRGDNLLASSYDKRVLWHDLDLATTPYKTLRYHEKAVRLVKFHKSSLPLFASASDDGSIHVFHGTVYDDLMSNPLLVPLKKLTGHKVINSIGVLDMVWHPKEAWLFTAGADGTARLWTS